MTWQATHLTSKGGATSKQTHKRNKRATTPPCNTKVSVSACTASALKWGARSHDDLPVHQRSELQGNIPSPPICHESTTLKTKTDADRATGNARCVWGGGESESEPLKSSQKIPIGTVGNPPKSKVRSRAFPPFGDNLRQAKPHSAGRANQSANQRSNGRASDRPVKQALRQASSQPGSPPRNHTLRQQADQADSQPAEQQGSKEASMQTSTRARKGTSE